MKKSKFTRNWQNFCFAIVIIITAFVSVVSCENPFITALLPSRVPTSTPQTVEYESADAAGNTYILVITENTSRAAYTGAAGDSYLLTIKQPGQPDKESKGVVSSMNADGTLSLKPTKADDIISVKIDNSGKMTAINGTITLDDGGTITAPGAVTPVGGGNSGGPFTSVEDMAAWLSAQPANTAATAYAVKLNVAALTGIADALKTNNTKYINLDLSGSTITSIPDYGLEGREEGYDNLTSIIIPSSVTIIGNYGFRDCSNLASITLGSNVTSIGWHVFNSCPKLTSIMFQSTITEANFHADQLIGDLRAKYLAGGIGTYTTTAPVSDSSVWTKQGSGGPFTSVADMAAWLSAQPANTIDTPYTVKLNVNNNENLDQLRNAFPSPTRYINLDLSGSTVTEIPCWGDENDTLGYTNVTGVILPSSVTSITSYAFRNFSITSMTIPDNVTGIGWYVFSNCTRLTSVTIGSGLTSINDGFFYNCTNLISVTIQGTIIESNISDGAFPGDLKAKYLAGGIGTYTTTAPVSDSSVWTKQ